MARIPILKPSIPSLRSGTIAVPPKQAEQHYRTNQHIRWSHLVRQRANFTCERCGARSVRVRLFADHIKEIRDGGTWDLDNGQCLCGSCHTNKTNAERAKRVFR